MHAHEHPDHVLAVLVFVALALLLVRGVAAAPSNRVPPPDPFDLPMRTPCVACDGRGVRPRGVFRRRPSAAAPGRMLVECARCAATGRELDDVTSPREFPGTADEALERMGADDARHILAAMFYARRYDRAAVAGGSR